MGSLEDRIAALEARADSLGSADLALRSLLQQLSAETLRSRRLATDADVAAMSARLGPGSLTGAHGLRGGSHDRTVDLGSPLLARLRDDSSLGGLVAGRYDSFDGYANALVDPTFERMTLIATTIGTGYTALGSAWEAKYVLNSGTVATTRTMARINSARNADGYAFLSSSIPELSLIFGNNASDMTVYLRPTAAFNLNSGLALEPSWLVGSVRVWPQSTAGSSSVTAYLEIVDGSDTVLVAGDAADLMELEGILTHARLEAAYQDPAVSTNYRWRLRIDVTKAAGSPSAAEVRVAEALMSGSDDGSVPSFTPAIGSWIPAFSGARFYRASNQTVTNVTDEDLVFNEGAGTGTKVYDTDGYHSDSNAGRFAAPVSGVYHVDAGAEWTANATGVRGLWLELNGAATVYARVRELNPIGGTIAYTQLSTDLQLSAGDYVTARVRQNSGGGLDIIAGRSSFLNIRLVGVGQW